MACKRALLAAVLNGTAASDIFTQDPEDMLDKEMGLTSRGLPKPRATAGRRTTGPSQRPSKDDCSRS